MWDFGSVQIHGTSGTLDVSFPFADGATKDVVKQHRGRWNPERKLWQVDLSRARSSAEDVAEAVRRALERAAPEAWLKALPKLSKAATTTRRFGLSIGVGGARITIPAGHKHEYTMKDMKGQGVSRDRGDWVVPSAFAVEPSVRTILSDVLLDDRTHLARMIDNMEGFDLNGILILAEGEARSIGLDVGAVVFADPSFVEKADPALPKERVREYPFLVKVADATEEGVRTSVSFLTGTRAWDSLRRRYGEPEASRGGRLDGTHVSGKWVRKRA